MANHIVIIKLTNGNVQVQNSQTGKNTTLRPTLSPYESLSTTEVLLTNHNMQVVAFFTPENVLKVIRADGTEVLINDQRTLFNELSDNFFFESVALIPSENIVDTYADLPDPSVHLDEVWFVRNVTGTWVLGTRRESGWYRSTGSEWVKANEITKYFVDDELAFKDGSDLSKVLHFELNQISSSSQRVATWQDKNGVVAYLEDLEDLKFVTILDENLPNVTRAVVTGRTIYTVTHTLDSIDIIGRIHDKLTNEEVVMDIKPITTSELEVSGKGNIANNLYKLTIT